MNVAAVGKGWEGKFIDGKFPLLQWLGSSEHSAVFLTELNGQKQRPVVIKLIPAYTRNAAVQLSRWRRASGLSHPHLARLFDWGECEIDATPLVYVVMEYAEEDLSQIVPLRPLTPTEAREMLLPVVEVLSYLHEKGLVHGHIKPSNLTVVDNQLKLSCDSIHEPGELEDALEPSVYNAPETETGTTLPTADLWSLGITLVTALNQHPPTGKHSEKGEPILPDSIPEPFRDIACVCLQREPGDRSTLGNIVTRLRSTSVPLSEVASSSAAVKRNLMRGMMATFAGVSVVLLLFAGMRVTHRTTAPILSLRRAEQPVTNITPPLSLTRSKEASISTVKDVVVPGSVAERVLPDVSQNARNGIHGKVRVGVRVSVNPAGEVLAARLQSSGPSRYFANLAIEAARNWKFNPPQVDGQSVASEWILRFQFGRKETQVVPSLAGKEDGEGTKISRSKMLEEHKVHLAKEIRYIQNKAAQHNRQLVTVGQLMLFSTETGDAWALDERDHLAAPLARDGNPIPLENTDSNYSIGWKGHYRIDGPIFIYTDSSSGWVTTILGYPVRKIARAG